MRSPSGRSMTVTAVVSTWSSSRRSSCQRPLSPAGVVVGHVGRGLAAEQVQADAVVEVQVFLNHVERDAAVPGDVAGVVLAHELCRALHHPVHARGAHEHVVRLFLEHELTRPRQRVERALLQRAELVLPVPVGEVGEHEERQPVRGLLVERAEDARRVRAAGVAQQQRLGLVPAGPAEVGVQQVHHGPQVPALLHVHLEQVAQVIQAGRGQAEAALLLHRGGLGVALHHDQALQAGPVLARDLLPGRFALVLAEPDPPVRRPARPGRSPTGSRGAVPGRSGPSPPGPRPPRCAGTRPGSAGWAPSRPTTAGTGAARTPAPAAACRSSARSTLLGMRSE